jgi:DNA topoisomerase I
MTRQKRHQSEALTVPPPRQLARQARLRYTSDEEEGISRVRRGTGFIYKNGGGTLVRSREQLARIRALGIPPAWTNVWICSHPRGHLQATGRDVRGRKQYIYHPDWNRQASRTKFTKLRAFGEALPAIRRQVRRHLAEPRLTRLKVLAAIVELLDDTLVRVGNEEYVRSNGSFGLTTLRDRHAKINGSHLKLQFLGKSGQSHEIELQNPRIARIVRQCQELPGQQLFQYRDEDGALHRVESADVNRYLRRITGQPFTAKDFRTWRATARVLERLHDQSAAALTVREARRAVAVAIREAATALGNTVTICRNYYVHPRITELFEAGRLSAYCGSASVRAGGRLSGAERLLLKVLRKMERKRRKKPQPK